MTPHLLFGAVFISQIVLVSIRYPRRLRGLVGSGQGGDSLLEAYVLASHVIGAVGLVLLAALFYLDTSDDMTAVLLSIGLFFLLQLSPLAMPSVQRSWSRLSSARSHQDTDDADTYRSTRLFDVVGALPVGIAAALFLAYVVLAGSAWGGELDTHLLKMAVFTGTQTLFVGSIAWSLSSLRQATADKAEELYQGIRRLAPLLVFASIMISVYYFGKELLAALDEPQLRPAMMSAFLQLLAALAFNALSFERGHGRQP